MKEVDFPIGRINDFLSSHTFSVPTDFGIVNVKVQLTGEKEYLRVGTPTPYIEYTMYILPSGNTDKIYNLLFGVYGDEVKITTTSNEFLDLRFSVANLLENMLVYFGIDKRTMCTKVINNIDNHH